MTDLGPTGYIGRSGVYLGRDYVARGWAERGEILDHWHALQRARTIDDLETPRANQTVNKLARPHCDEDDVDASVKWFHEGCQNGWFDPPPCDPAAGGDPAHCGTLYAVVPEFDPGALPQMVTNLGLNLSIAFAGPHLQTLVRERIDAGSPVLYYHWRPSAFSSRVRSRRVSFPEEETDAAGSCSHNNINSNYGPVSCDFPPVQVSKFVWGGLAAAAPEAYALLSALRVQSTEMDRLLAAHHSVGEGANTTTLACRWVRDHRAVRAARALPPANETARSSRGHRPPQMWESWTAEPTACDVSFMRVAVLPCDGDRLVTFSWAKPHPRDPSRSAECAGGVKLLPAQRVSCDHSELSSPQGAAVFVLSLCLTLVCASTVALLCIIPRVLPKRHWPSILRHARLKFHWRGAMTLFTSGFLLLSCIVRGARSRCGPPSPS